MNRILLAINIVLLLAVGVLYYLYFKYTSADEHKINEANAAVKNSFKLAYFDLDSLEDKYDYYKEVRDYLRGRDSQMTQQLNKLRTGYMSKVKEYNQRGPTMSQTEQSEYQQQLIKMRDDYQQRQDEMGQDMHNISMQKLQEVKANIQSFLKDYCKEKGYAYVFASDDNDYLYYKDTLRNITPEIVQLLNERYKQTKKE